MKSLFTVMFFIALLPFIILASIIHVPTEQPSIQAGIDAATNGDIVLVDDGTYLENINFKGKAITVASNFIMNGDTSHRNNTIIDGSQPTHPDSGSVVYFISGEDTTSVLYGFTITGGTGTVSFAGGSRLARAGGGILIADVGAKISHNYIFNNSVADSFAVLGGGLAAGAPWSTSFVIIENNIFDSNSCLRSVFVSQGGGMAITTKARVCNNIFSNNVVSSDSGEAFGGGFSAVFNLDSVLIYNNSIINNKVESLYGTDPSDFALGGGFMIWNDMTANFKMYGNIIAYNEVSGSIRLAGAGGCFEDVDGEVLFANNLVYDNFYTGTVDCHGTGIGIKNNTVLSIINNTITGNEASPNGGALSTEYTISTKAINNIFWGNSAGASMPEIDIWQGPAPEITYSNVQTGWTGTGNINVDPLFVPGDTLYHLGIGSPCINAGNPDSLCNDYDGTRNDMGAYGGIPDSLAKYINIILKIEDKIEIPQKYILKQNYPNPFNPTTNIEFSIPKTEFVTLKIYNLLGQEVATLVFDKLNPGSYKYNWDASKFASGIYYYKIQAGSFIQTKKLIFLK